MNILLLAAQGQLGTDLSRELESRGHKLHSLTHADLEIQDAAAVRECLQRIRPDLVINPAAFHKVEECEKRPEQAFAVNSIGAWNVARAAAACGAGVVFFSTDYVFGGGGGHGLPWRESDCPIPLNVYGASKLAGEALVAAATPRHFILRVSGLFGQAGSSGKGGNFVETMIRKAQEGLPVRVVNDQILSPTFTRHLAQAVATLIRTDHFGLYHLSAADACSWYEFAAAIYRMLSLTVDLRPVSSLEFPSPVLRPMYSVLDNDKYRQLCLPPIPAWEAGLQEYLQARA